MRSTPVEIEAMLQAYYSPVPHSNARSITMQQAYGDLIAKGLLVPDTRGHFEATERGKAWVEMICHTPVPQKAEVWVDPRTGKTVDRN